MSNEFIIDQQVSELPDKAYYQNDKVTTLQLTDALTQIGAYCFSECQSLLEVYFGDQMKCIGRHAFYGCRKLSRISIAGDFREIGDGAFKNCTKISFVEVREQNQKTIVLGHLFDELQQELMVRIKYQNQNDAVLYFPRDLIMYSEFTSRLYDPVTYGMGYRYRQMAIGNQIDYQRYDELFSGAVNELTREQLNEIAMCRLTYPVRLELESKEIYIDYVKQDIMSVLRKVIEEEQMERLECMLKEVLISKDAIQSAIDYARECNQVEISSKLVTYKNRHFGLESMEMDLCL